MKIGFSFGRCIRDIVNGEVDYDDVAWIISGTAVENAESAKFVIQDYMYRHDYLEGLDEEKCMEVGMQLFNEGKIFQPRLQGIRAFRIPEGALWADMFPTNMANNQAAKTAWEAYRFMLHMTAQVPEDAKENWKG
jgi:hypothetical protein